MTVLTTADGVDIAYTVHGDGPPVLLVHGWTCDGSDWSWLAADLAVDHRVVIVDLRGHGRSTPTVDRFGAEVVADDMIAVLDAIGIDRAVVVGHSLGGTVGSVMAVEHPDRVSALVLVDPKYGLRDTQVERSCAAMAEDPVRTSQKIFATFFTAETPSWQRFWHERSVAARSPEWVAWTYQAMFGPGTLGRRSVAQSYLAGRRCPTLAVYAGSAGESAEWDRSLPHGSADRIVVWDGAGHFLHQERPAEFAQLMREWLVTAPTNGG